jgi:hypothetical protein
MERTALRTTADALLPMVAAIVAASLADSSG